jgi:RNA polymerase sigma factor (sigma-70 family)
LINEGEHINSIVSGCRKGDRKAQEKLYRNFYRAMMSLCLRYTKNETDALAVLNTGFYKVYKNIERFDAGKATLYTWIRTIIINSCLDHLRAQSGRIVQDELDQAAAVDLPPDVFSKLSAQDILIHVRKLPPATRAVFNLFVMEGYSHREIATFLGISEGTSKWHLSEARKTLQKLINTTDSN